MLLKGKLPEAVVIMNHLPFTGPVGRVYKEEIRDPAAFNGLLKIGAPDRCRPEPPRYLEHVPERYNPASILTSVADIEMTFEVMSPHSFKACSVEIQCPSCPARQV